jgi:hypothetical protein
MKPSLHSAKQLLAHLFRKHGFVLIPMVVVLLLAGVLLVATNGLSVVAPFVYALF